MLLGPLLDSEGTFRSGHELSSQQGQAVLLAAHSVNKELEVWGGDGDVS
jgi:hypothetical protein